MEPVFTTSAYHSFYAFYGKYAGVPANYTVRSDLNLLNTTVVDGWGYSSSLYEFITSEAARQAGLVLGNNTFILTDVDVDRGGLFSKDGTALYNVVVLGFEEYVSAKEYMAFRHFVLGGGTLIILCGGSFLAEVRYSPTTNTVALVKGHGWYFDGKEAVKSVYNRWYANNTEWVGSNYAYYQGSQQYVVEGAVANTSNPYSVMLRAVFGESLLFSGYGGHEENVMTNSSDSVIAYWILSGLKQPKGRVAIYELHSGRGTVYHMGVFATDLLMGSGELQFLLLSLIGIHTVRLYTNSSGCKLEVVARVEGEPPPNTQWEGWIYIGTYNHTMTQLNSTTLAYTTTDCTHSAENITVIVEAGGLVGAYAQNQNTQNIQGGT